MHLYSKTQHYSGTKCNKWHYCHDIYSLYICTVLSAYTTLKIWQNDQM